MTHVHGHENPNQHCPKCVINDGLMALLASLLEIATRRPDENKPRLNAAAPLNAAARDLVIAAQASYGAYRVLTEQGAIGPFDDKVDWSGCEQATKLADWVKFVDAGFGFDAVEAVADMRSWTKAAKLRAAALVSGGYGKDSE